MCKFITKITVPRTLWGLKPLQGYIRELAAICGVAPERLLQQDAITRDDVTAESEWAQKLRDYIFEARG